MDTKSVIHLFGESASGAEPMRALQGGRKAAGISARKSIELAHSPATGSVAPMRPRRLVRARQTELPERSSAAATQRCAARPKLHCRFLSWWFPVREFNSPLQRLLYLSVEGPKGKSSRRWRRT